MSGRAALQTLVLAIAAGACSDAPDDTPDADRPLTAEFVEVFRVGATQLPNVPRTGAAHPPRVFNIRAGVSAGRRAAAPHRA